MKNARPRIRLLHTALLMMEGLVIATIGQSAMAATPVLPSEGGLLVLPNVKVEVAAQPADTRSKSMSASGMKAYKDHESAPLRGAAPEELMEEAQTARTAGTPSFARFSSSGSGRKSAQLDESFMSYAVVRKGENGKIDMQCVTGEAQAQAALKGVAVSKEARHAH